MGKVFAGRPTAGPDRPNPYRHDLLMCTGNLDRPTDEDIAPHGRDPKDPASGAVHDAQLFLTRTGPLTPDRFAELEGLLRALADVRWEDATPEQREAGWHLTLRLTLLKRGPVRGHRPAAS
jgi:hypothetical protein